MAVLTVQFKVGEDRTQALVRLYDTIMSNRDWVSPKLGVGEPIIKPMGIDDVPIVALTLWTADPQRGAYELERIAHAAEIELKRVPGTREVQTLGGPGRVCACCSTPSACRATASRPRTCATRCAANVALPSGSLVATTARLRSRPAPSSPRAADVRSVVVGTFQGKPVFVSDVAQVVDGPDQPTRYVWHGAKGRGRSCRR